MHHHHDSSATNAKEYVKFGFVLVLIAVVSCGLYRYGDQSGIEERMRLFMGVFMTTFAGFKLIGYRMFVDMFPMYDLVAAKSRIYAALYPFIELTLGLAYLGDLFGDGRHIVTALIMGVGALGITNSVYLRKQKIHCACLGNVIRLPLSTVSLAEDVLMFAMAMYMITL